MDQIWQIIMLLILLEFVKTIKKSIYKYSKSAVTVKPQSTEMFCRIKNNRPRQR